MSHLLYDRFITGQFRWKLSKSGPGPKLDILGLNSPISAYKKCCINLTPTVAYASIIVQFLLPINLDFFLMNVNIYFIGYDYKTGQIIIWQPF